AIEGRGLRRLALQCSRSTTSQIIEFGGRRLSGGYSEDNQRQNKSHAGCEATSILYLKVMRVVAVAVMFLVPIAWGQQTGVDQLFAHAMEQQQRGDFAAAVRDYRQVVKLQPD